ncbi:Hypothetical protein FKW44_013821, partial [Caligus rogercresseyi]
MVEKSSLGTIPDENAARQEYPEVIKFKVGEHPTSKENAKPSSTPDMVQNNDG